MKYKLTYVQSVDELLFLSFLVKLYRVLQVLSAKTNWNLNQPIDFIESIVKIANLLESNVILVYCKKPFSSTLQSTFAPWFLELVSMNIKLSGLGNKIVDPESVVGPFAFVDCMKNFVFLHFKFFH